MASTADVMRTYLDRITSGDFEGAVEFYHDDLVAHVSGHNPTSGTYEGKAAFVSYLGEATGRVESMRIEEHDLLVSDDHAVVLNTMHAERSGATLDSQRVVVYHLSGDKITELWVIDQDQAAVDAFFG